LVVRVVWFLTASANCIGTPFYVCYATGCAFLLL
jgi:hypothetical protein